MQGVAEREVVLLDRDDVREVGADVERELEAERSCRLVPDDEVILHPLAHESLARDRERVLREPVGDGVTEVEGCGEVLDLARREQQRPGAVDAKLEPREETGVLGEEAAGAAVEIADLVADAEGRALEDRHPHARSILADDAGAARLRERGDDDLIDVHVRRPREREKHALGDVLGADRPAESDALDRARLRIIASEAHFREVRLDQPRSRRS